MCVLGGGGSMAHIGYRLLVGSMQNLNMDKNNDSAISLSLSDHQAELSDFWWGFSAAFALPRPLVCSCLGVCFQVIDFSGNRLTGPVPNSLGSLSNTLHTLRLGCNVLSGPIPKWLDSRFGNLKVSFSRQLASRCVGLITKRVARRRRR